MEKPQRKAKSWEELSLADNYMCTRVMLVIFICLFDPFGKEEPVYTFKNTCVENSEAKYDDKMLKVFYNCKNCDKHRG